MYFFIGIKGAGMSSLAIILKKLGSEVMGSDIDKQFFTQTGLDNNNIKYVSYNENNIKEGYTIIKGASITDDHEEIKKAKELGLTIINYNEMVGKLTRMFKTITVAGCHGKTTTSSMIAHVFNNIIGCNYLVGDGTGDASIDNNFFVLEACEYRRHFLEYEPYYAIITNIDLDHVDYFKDINDVIDAYTKYASKSINTVIACGDDKYTKNLGIDNVLYYGIDNKDNNVIATNIKYYEDGTIFDVYVDGKLYGKFNIPVYGKYQLLDALACISVCYKENIDASLVNNAFKTFMGARRRFTSYIAGDCVVIDDYAHHPKEVEALMECAYQKYPDKKKIIIFQPHTFSRTKEFASDLVHVFNKADAAYILDIHPAREKQEDFPNITSNIIIDNLDNGYHLDMSNIENLYKYNNAVYMFMSPNDVTSYENKIIKYKKGIVINE